MEQLALSHGRHIAFALLNILGISLFDITLYLQYYVTRIMRILALFIFAKLITIHLITNPDTRLDYRE